MANPTNPINPVIVNPPPPLPPLPPPIPLRRQYSLSKYEETPTTSTLITASGGDIGQLTPAQEELAYQILITNFGHILNGLDSNPSL